MIIAGDLSAVRADGTLLSDQTAELLFTQEWAGGDSVIQAVCATDDYIITLENTSHTEITADVVTAYYKNDTDAAGNPVEKYSVAMRSGDLDWEHGNCMTYNPNTGYVYVALYTAFNPDLRGCIHVMDPSNLSLVGTQKISDDFNVLSIAYDESANVYYAQADGAGSYRIFILNTDFQIIDDLGPADPTPGYNFQGFCKSGDYLLQAPLTLGLGVGEYMMAYSIPEQRYVDVVGFNYGREDPNNIETEQIAPMGDGSFVVVVNNSRVDEIGYGDVYRVIFPHLSAVTEAAPQPPPEETSDEEVTITTEMEQMTSVDTSAFPEEEPQNNKETSGKPFDPVPVILIPAIAAAAFFGIRAYRIRLERRRRVRNARAKQRRKRLIEEMEREIDEMNI